MDLLGSILGSMQAPPSIGDKEKKAAEARRAAMKKRQEERKKKMATLRKKMEEKISKFCKDDKATKLECDTMTKVERSTVHELLDAAGLVGHSFGEEDVDRHLVIWKKEHVPCDAQLTAMRNGVEYIAPDPNAEKVATITEQRRVAAAAAPAPKSDYMAKYKSIIGEETGQTVSLTVSDAKAYGCVPSALKRDHRTIEETMNEIKKRKKSLPGSSEVKSSQPSEQRSDS